jgi:single-strand DNA-binding protein
VSAAKTRSRRGTSIRAGHEARPAEQIGHQQGRSSRHVAEHSHPRGNIAAELELAYTPTGKQVVRFPVLVNRRRKDPDTGEWSDGEPTRHSCTAFGVLGEHLADSLTKGDPILVAGTVTTDAWYDKDTGDKRTAQRVLVDAAGPSLRFATAAVRKAQRTNATPDGDAAAAE